MFELKTIRRVTVYADAALEPTLVEHFLELGAKGYSETDCRGKGKLDVMGDPLTGLSFVRIEVLVQRVVGERIMQYLTQPQFESKALTACIETVQVSATDDF